MVPQELIEDLNAIGYPYDLIDDGQRIFIIFKEYPLPPGIYNVEKTELMIYTTPYYPSSGFDMFWVEVQLTLKNGTIPKAGDAIEDYVGKKWRRFSYHPYQGKPWDPSNDSVITYVEYINKRLQNGD